MHHGIASLDTPKSEGVDLTLPKLKGDNIEEHFYNIAKEQAEPYQKLISSIITSELPQMPKVIKLSFNSKLTLHHVHF